MRLINLRFSVLYIYIVNYGGSFTRCLTDGDGPRIMASISGSKWRDRPPLAAMLVSGFKVLS